MADRFSAFGETFARMPLVAILRGLAHDRAPEIAEALVGAGLTVAEVPLNGPKPLDAIDRLKSAAAGRLLVGAGTVLTAEALFQAVETGAEFAVSPNLDERVMHAAREADLPMLPGVMTPSEAFRALELGAAGLKLFPAEASSPKALAAMRQVLPAGARILPVGGVTAETLEPWWRAGAAGFGLGSALFKPGGTAAETGAAARRFVAAMRPLLAERAAA